MAEQHYISASLEATLLIHRLEKKGLIEKAKELLDSLLLKCFKDHHILCESMCEDDGTVYFRLKLLFPSVKDKEEDRLFFWNIQTEFLEKGRCLLRGEDVNVSLTNNDFEAENIQRILEERFPFREDEEERSFTEICRSKTRFMLSNWKEPPSLEELKEAYTFKVAEPFFRQSVFFEEYGLPQHIQRESDALVKLFLDTLTKIDVTRVASRQLVSLAGQAFLEDMNRLAPIVGGENQKEGEESLKKRIKL